MTRSAHARRVAEAGMTLAQWAALPDDEPGELVDGRLVEEEMADAVHELIVGFFVALLRGWVVPRGGVVLASDAKYGVRPRHGRKPDLTAYLPRTKPPPRRGLIRNPPDLAVEVVSPTPRDGRRDRVEKPDDYAAFRVRWYWLVDPELRTVEIWELGRDRRYRRAAAASSGQVRKVPGMRGLVIDLDALWTELDRLGPDER